MKISEAMMLCDKHAGEPVDSELKLCWLDRIEEIIYNEIIKTHENAFEKPLSCKAGERDLIAGDPYSELYTYYMAMQNDILLRDSIGYANNAALFSAAYDAFSADYNRKNMPLATVKRIRTENR